MSETDDRLELEDSLAKVREVKFGLMPMNYVFCLEIEDKILEVTPKNVDAVETLFAKFFATTHPDLFPDFEYDGAPWPTKQEVRNTTGSAGPFGSINDPGLNGYN